MNDETRISDEYSGMVGVNMITMSSLSICGLTTMEVVEKVRGSLCKKASEKMETQTLTRSASQL